MHNNPQSDDTANAAPADTAPSAIQTPKVAALPNQDGVEVAPPVTCGEIVERQDPGGFVQLDEHGMFQRFVPLRESRDCQTSAATGSERSTVRSPLATTEPTSSSTV